MKNIAIKNYLMTDRSNKLRRYSDDARSVYNDIRSGYYNHDILRDSKSDMLLSGLSQQYMTFEYILTTSLYNRRWGGAPELYIPNRATVNCFKLNAISSFYYGDIKFNMISCPGGYADKDNFIENPFMLGETVVTQELFETVMGFNYSGNSEAKHENNPIIGITWYDCVVFCNKLSDYFGFSPYYYIDKLSYWGQYVNYGKETRETDSYEKYAEIYPKCIKYADVSELYSTGFRLPTEWEWQIAAKAGTDNQYAGTDNIEELSKFAHNRNISYKPDPIAVAQKKPNEWGFYDMTGNVAQWCNNYVRNDNDDDDDDDDDDDNKYKVKIQSGQAIRGGGYRKFKWGSQDEPIIRMICDRDQLAREIPSLSIGFRIAKSIF
jgi:formylglycine-generating enzyme required for sulfatase activity